ncbi:YkgJ family cysteine cluster protein [Aliarcobacter trophiarum]|uniref:YkgJ family cysteine cluster protein n=1 Tax=Aliarcobacter trophiarum TaxID=708186 RepID=UPI00100BBD84|nr:YkgJ family cysteine cluster protein [Aliarcobacter trophiarum]RXI27829.1 zinc/iron-chelating domain-containing protein [Aliarcobacter trophiarum]
MKNFIKIEDKNIFFGDCKNCQAFCCKGSYGSIFSQILKEEFASLYKNFPILFIFGSLDFIKPVVMLSNGIDSCPYLKNSSCSIYKDRPNVCKTYPLSPNIDDNIYIDSSCPEIFKGKNSLDLTLNIFENYSKKYIDTHFEFKELKKEEFLKILNIRGVEFYKYIGKNNSIYLNYHEASLKNLDILL